jgi:metal-responsive CopG/Arc/MetJ family transcriptional regulator
MQAIKTAISMDKNLFAQAETFARSMNVSRSRFFSIAVEEFIAHNKNRELLAQINAAYSDEPDATERALRSTSRRLHRHMVEGEW